jgi:nucleotide-binding universal stress UspA family protein
MLADQFREVLFDSSQRERIRPRKIAHRGSVAPVIVEVVWAADLIVIGTRARGGVARLFLGSVADKVVRGANCPLLVVPHPVRAKGPC